MPTPRFDSADPALIEEIISEARARLEVQLTAAIAADQRAMTFAGLLFAGTAVLVGLALGKDAQPAHEHPLLCVAAGFVIAAALACLTARPTGWHQLGNYPSSFEDDVQNNLKLADTRAQTAANYEKMLKENEATLQLNGWFMRASMLVASVSAIAGIFSALV
jgi:hypothetical protein